MLCNNNTLYYISISTFLTILLHFSFYLSNFPNDNSSYTIHDLFFQVLLYVPKHILIFLLHILHHYFSSSLILQNNLPEQLEGRTYYEPTQQGHEKIISQRLSEWWNLKREAPSDKSP